MLCRAVRRRWPAAVESVALGDGMIELKPATGQGGLHLRLSAAWRCAALRQARAGGCARSNARRRVRKRARKSCNRVRVQAGERGATARWKAGAWELGRRAVRGVGNETGKAGRPH